MKEGTSIEAHLKDMKVITDKLAAIGAPPPPSEENQVVTLLGSLLCSYAILVTVLEAKVDDVQLSHVQQALIHEEQKLDTITIIECLIVWKSTNFSTAWRTEKNQINK